MTKERSKRADTALIVEVLEGIIIAVEAAGEKLPPNVDKAFDELWARTHIRGGNKPPAK